MPAPDSFGSLMADLRKAMDMLAQVHQEAPASPEKDMLGQMLSGLETSHAEAETAVPAAVQAIRESNAQTERDLVEFQKKYEQAVAQSEATAQQAQEAASVPSPKMSEVAADTKLGAKLRRELLDEFSETSKPTSTSRPREIWDDWD